MFICNDLNLLTFTYYLKITLAILMTIVPFVLFESITIQTIKYKQKNNKLDKIILKKDLKKVFYILVIFILSLTLHNTLNTEDNKCYMYAKSEIIKEYKTTYYALKDENISNEVKNMYLENTLIVSYNNLNNNFDSNDKQVVTEIDNPLENDEIIQTLSLEHKTEKDNFLKETDTTKLNNVYVENGVFYYPQYVNGNRNTYSGMTCPSDPLNQGYNNKYGYNNYFYNRLIKFIDEASKNGYKITYSSQGCRTYETQRYYYNTMVRGRAAYPGYSLHGFGIASDLEFYQSDGSVCAYGRTATSCPSMGWAHQNASKFGLTFPLLNASYREDWHIEPITKVKY